MENQKNVSNVFKKYKRNCHKQRIELLYKIKCKEVQCNKVSVNRNIMMFMYCYMRLNDDRYGRRDSRLFECKNYDRVQCSCDYGCGKSRRCVHLLHPYVRIPTKLWSYSE